MVSGGPVDIFALVRNWKMPHRKFNLTVRELPPLVDHWGETALRRLIDNFACLAAGSLERQCKCQRLLVRHPVCQVTRTNKHVRTPARLNTVGRERRTGQQYRSLARRIAIDRAVFSPLSTEALLCPVASDDGPAY